ncbi:MAG: hypothetical protein PHD15_04550 [Clostridia bacterium]|nr:hypothetical protein [Clostridia bacterium]MDD4387010.1 hypothetical protein [Clostridia bacterium]
MYYGYIIEESLINKKVLNKFKILKLILTSEWHLYKFELNKEDIYALSENINNATKWYCHFWNDNKDLIVVFKDKVFETTLDDLEEQEKIKQYGINLGIPKSQMNFLID